MTKMIGEYWHEKYKHWVKVLEPTKDNHTPHIHSKSAHRMKSSERKQTYHPTTEDNLRQQIVEFLDRKRGENFEKA